MKKVLLALSLLTSMSSFAVEYACIGADESFAKLDATAQPQEIGHLNGRKLTLADDGELVTLTIKDEKLITVVSATSGAISFHQNDGEKASSVNCVVTE